MYGAVLYRFRVIRRWIMSWLEIWVRNHSRSLGMAPFKSLWYGFIFAFHVNYRCILYCFGDKVRYWSKIEVFHTPLVFDVPVWYEKLEWSGYPMVKKFEDMCNRFDRIPACDRRTDGQTNKHLATAESAIFGQYFASSRKWYRYRYSYCAMRIGDSAQAFEWYHFWWPPVICSPNFKVTIVTTFVDCKTCLS